MGGHDPFEEKVGVGIPVTKISVTLFVGNEVLNIFHLQFFFEKKQIFLFGRHGALDDKNKCNLFCGKCYTNYCFKVFSSKRPILVE